MEQARNDAWADFEAFKERLTSEGVEVLAAWLYEIQRTYSQPKWDAPEPKTGRGWLTPHRRDHYRDRARKYIGMAISAAEEQV